MSDAPHSWHKRGLAARAGAKLWSSTVGCRKAGCLSVRAKSTVSSSAGSALRSNARDAGAWPRGPIWRQSTTCVVPTSAAAPAKHANGGNRIIRYSHFHGIALHHDLDPRGDLLQPRRRTGFGRLAGRAGHGWQAGPECLGPPTDCTARSRPRVSDTGVCRREPARPNRRLDADGPGAARSNGPRQLRPSTHRSNTKTALLQCQGNVYHDRQG